MSLDTVKRYLNKPVKPIIDRIAGDGTAEKVKAAGTKAMSKVTGISEAELTKKRPSIAQKIGEAAPKVARALARKVDSAGKKIVDVTSDILSYPTRKYWKMKEEDQKIRDDRNMEQRRLKQMDESGVRDKGDESDPLFRYRATKAARGY